MIRRTVHREGFDCVRHPCGKNGCGQSKGANHGIHCEEYIYVVSNDSSDLSLTLVLFSGIFPKSVPTELLAAAGVALQKPHGADLTLHVGFPITREALRKDDSRACEWVQSGRCFADGFSTALGARDFVESHFDTASKFTEQPESFWGALEAKFLAWAKSALVERVNNRYKQCSRCAGIGSLHDERCMPCDGIGTVRKSQSAVKT